MQPEQNAYTIQVLYQDQDFLVVYKPAGMPTQPDKTGDRDLLSLVAEQLDLADLLAVHRLDRPVAGLLILALNARTQSTLTDMIQRRLVQKNYTAVVCGSPEPCGELDDMLVRDGRTNCSRVSPKSPRAKRAKLAYETVQSVQTPDGQALSLLTIHLETGRHHQIRVQLSHAGWPIWGDTKYNPAFTQRGGWHQIALISNQLAFQHPTSGKAMAFEIELPHVKPFNLFNF